MKKRSKILIILFVCVVLAGSIIAILFGSGAIGPGNTTAPTQSTAPSETDASNVTDPSSTEPVHTHKYMEEQVAPTCTEGGYTRYTCAGCGDTYTEAFTGAIGHSWDDWSVIQEPTTEEDGIRERACSNCGETETEPIDKLEPDHTHNYSPNTVAPTCSEQGYTQYTCSCGATYQADFTEPLGHSYVKNVTEPTCAKAGYSTYTCSACGNAYEGDYVEATGHAYGAWATTTEPNCTDNGEAKRTCEACGNVETQEVAALGHDYTETVVDATCIEPGSVTKTCSRCGASEVETTDALGHAWSDWEITTEPTPESVGKRERICSNCGEYEVEEIPAVGDTGGDGEEYESYIDPRIEIKKGPRYIVYSYGNISIVDRRGWGDPPSIWVNEDGSLTVIFINLDGQRVESVVEVPPEGYCRTWTIWDDGEIDTYLIGDLG